MLLIKPIVRNDRAGQGHFAAPRGTRLHNGIDYHVAPGSVVLSPVRGEVTNHGRPYSDGPYRYVQVTSEDGYRHRLFYVLPGTTLGEHVDKGYPVGTAQDITKRYPDSGMLPHVHYEIMKPDRRLCVDPEDYFKKERGLLRPQHSTK